MRRKVVIVGGGLSGLAAATQLVTSGISFLLIEPRDYLGGRACTIHADEWPLPLEMGAEFVHGDARSVTEAAKAARIPLIDQQGAHWTRRRGKIVEAAFDDETKRALGSIAKTVRTRDRSLEDALAHTRLGASTKANLRSFIENFDASPAEDVSAKGVTAPGDESDRARRVFGGYGAIVDSFRKPIPNECLRLSTRITSIVWTEKGASIHVRARDNAEQPVILAEKVIVTIPLGVLSTPHGEGAITFSPPLEQKETALKTLAMGHVVKLHLLFRESFWDERVKGDARRFSLFHEPSLPFPTWWTQKPIEIPMLVGWAGGPHAVDLLKLTAASRIGSAIESLATIFRMRRSEIEAALVATREKDWSADPFSLGAYSYPRVNGHRAAGALARPLANTLFFAGEATAPAPHNGTTHGAIDSGHRAAREVLAALDR